MLILSRRINEKLRIGEDVVITACDIDRNQVRIGIEAPKHIAVHREEVLERLLGEPEGKVLTLAK